jgi:hypothetical protein
MTLPLDHVLTLDYEAHPAFAGLAAAPEDINGQADRMIAEIDAAYGAAQRADDPKAVFDATVAPRIETLTRLALSQNVPATFKPFAARALTLAHDTLRRNISVRSTTLSNSAAQSLPDTLRNGLADFHRDGFFETCTPGLARQVWRQTWIERAVLRARAARNPHRHAALALHYGSPAVRAIRRATRDSGLEVFISAYLGKPVRLLYASLDYAHPGQDWFKGCYAAGGIGDSKTVYMHFDADVDIIKALFYLRDVSDKDGPFRFVRGSHRWDRSPCQSAIHKGFDEASGNEFPMTDDQLDFEQGYYRPRFQKAEYRAGMLALPRALRGSTHFGDDVLDGSTLSEALLSHERSFTAPAGTMVIFDGSRGVHRGSLTTDGGERWAVQLAFKVQEEAVAHNVAAVRAHLSYLKHAARNLVNLATGKV